jgi:flagellar basal-body rod protein FlgG
VNIGVYNAVRGCLVQQVNYNTIANNLANAETAGFKQDLVYCDRALRAHQKTTTRQGNMQHTGNPLDIALSGNGYFKISTPKGIQYTRNGRFHLGADGMLMTSRGDPVQGSGGPVYIQGSEIIVNKGGGIQVDGAQIDSFSIAVFDESVTLTKQGPYYTLGDGETGEEIGIGETQVEQGYLEESNVVVSEEMVRMIESLRNFESYQMVIQTFGEIDTKAINDVGRPQ